MTTKPAAKNSDAQLDAVLAAIKADLQRAAAQVRNGYDHEVAFADLWDSDSEGRVAAYNYLKAQARKGVR